MGFERSGNRAADSGMKKIADLLPNTNDEMLCVLLEVESKETKTPGKYYNVYHLFHSEEGDVSLTSFSSNLDKVIEKATKEKYFDVKRNPVLYIGVERVAKSVNRDTGEPQEWHNVFVEAAQENETAATFRKTALSETKHLPPIQEGRPYAGSVAGGNYGGASRGDFDSKMNEAIFAGDDSEVPF